MIEFLLANWIGLAIGLVVAILIGTVIQCTAFNGNKIGWLFTIILAVVFGIAGAFIQDSLKNKNGLPTAEQRGETLSSTLKDVWTNTNGGMTKDQILASKNDKECPTYDDQIIDLYIQDFGSYVNISFYYGEIIPFFNTRLFHNFNMLKTSNGLIVDGLLERTGDFKVGYYGWPVVHLDDWTWYSHRKDLLPTYWKEYSAWNHDDLVSVASGFPSYLETSHWGQFNSGDGLLAEAMWQGIQLTANNVGDHFLKFDNNIELIGTSASADRTINSFYNYLYEQVKSIGYGNTKLVNASDLLCIPIPENLRVNFPTSKQFQQQFPGVEYYGVFNCDISVRCKYLKGNTDINATSNVEEYIEKNADKDITKVDPIGSKQEYSQVSLSFINKDESDISNVDFVSNAVKITFRCASLQLEKQVKITSLDQIKNGFDILLAKGEIWNYSINSRCLIFDDGVFETSNISTSHDISFSYTENYITFGVGVNLGAVDDTVINTFNTPILITLTKGSDRHIFKIDDNSQLNRLQYKYIEIGDYAYTIECNALDLEPSTGIITVSSINVSHIFEFVLNKYSHSFEFNSALGTVSSPLVTFSSNCGESIGAVILSYSGYDSEYNPISRQVEMVVNAVNYEHKLEKNLRLKSLCLKVVFTDGSYVISQNYTFDGNILLEDYPNTVISCCLTRSLKI